MRVPILTAKAALVAGAALALAACGSEPAVNNAADNELDANMTLEAPANDASAMEAAGNAAEIPAPADNGADEAEDTSTDSANTLESNVSGM